MKQLKSYQNTTASCNGDGISVCQDGIPIDILNHDKWELEQYMTVERIATAASRMIRYRGEHRMSNAQHCVRGADAFLLHGEIELAFAFLFHDALETILGDISRPVKYLPGIKEIIKPLENKLEILFFEIYDISYPLDSKIKTLDLNAAQDEMMDMKHGYGYPNIWDEKTAYDNFLAMYKKLIIYKNDYSKKEII